MTSSEVAKPDVSHDASLRVIRREPFNAESPPAALSHPITPAEHAYVRTNFGVPILDAAHEIAIGGAVATPLTLSLESLRHMTHVRIAATMECAGNDRLGMHPLPVGEPWEHGALSTLTWTGVPLVDVLTMAGVADDAVEVLISGADAGPRDDAPHVVQFARSLPLADALRRDTLLALEMNDAPLTPHHGAPVRLAVPGWYGMASVKWVTRIDVLRTPYNGYFQRQRYVYDDVHGVTPVDRMRVKSIIVSPENNAACTREITVRGFAWSGNGRITRVDVGIDGGSEWHSAILGEPESAHAWTPWHFTTSLPRSGRFVLRSRATDSAGATQPDAIVWNRLGYGNNAIRHIIINAD